MKYQLRVEKSVQKKIRKLDPQIRRRLTTAFVSILVDPKAGKSLEGDLQGLRSYRVGAYRIIYKVYDKQLVILVVNAGHRREIYKQ